jgi:hypothetical protein
VELQRKGMKMATHVPEGIGNLRIDKLVDFFCQAKGFGKAKAQEIRHAERLLNKFNWDVDQTLQYWNDEQDIKHLQADDEEPTLDL